MRRTANGLHTNETRKPGRTGSVKKGEPGSACHESVAAQAEPSRDRRRQFKGNKAEFAVLSDEGPTGPRTPCKLEEASLCQAP
jgi:hypothetical protein